jgi:hypothetical protein
MIHQLALTEDPLPDLNAIGLPTFAFGSRNVLADEHFDSRHEMRWSVFFKSLGIAYIREFATFHFGNVQYTPDFYLLRGGLRDQPVWLELKPYEPTVEALAKCRALAERGLDVALLFGKPALPFAYERDSVKRQEQAAAGSKAYVWRKGRSTYETGWGVFVVRDGTVMLEMVSSHPEEASWDHKWIRNALTIAYHVVPA